MAGKNEGEGSRTAARRYNEATQESVKKQGAAKPSKLTEQERREAEAAEEAGKSRAKELDPEEHRDFDRPTK
ncbi:MAG TPA: hypothetical protein VFV10_08790 [Gammaproteobacteria bacterium]|nr:hypothetical protein [Gammaproteobacteria bacterium]